MPGFVRWLVEDCQRTHTTPGGSQSSVFKHVTNDGLRGSARGLVLDRWKPTRHLARTLIRWVEASTIPSLHVMHQTLINHKEELVIIGKIVEEVGPICTRC